MTPSELKRKYQESHPDGHFFDRRSMKFFGDTMANFGCFREQDIHVLYRKNPVKHGVSGHFWFDAISLDYLGANH